jgi:excinuclease ABC subunit A
LPFSAEDSRAESVLEAELNAERRSDWIDETEKRPCPTCKGSRLNEVARAVRVRGQTLAELSDYSVKQALDKLARLKFSGPEKAIADTILSEIKQRLFFMQRVGLEYLALSRAANTLSGGESQRIRLAAQLGSNLRGVLYVLDEPTIGLHPRDNVRLLATLDALKAKGNTLVVVEHDEDTMRRADIIVDLGPGAGRHGGNVIACGPIAELQRHGDSVTGRYLRSPMPHPSRARRPVAHVPWIEIKGARANNLKEIDVSFPIGRLTAITGVSGSGKSTLMRSVLLPAVQQSWARKRTNGSSDWKKISGTEFLSAVYEVDQSPIGEARDELPAAQLCLVRWLPRQTIQRADSYR